MDMVKGIMNKSFLKWAGGKTKSLDMILETVGQVEGRFIEPFAGSGVVSLNVSACGCILSDCNEDLINIYNVLKTSNNFIELLKSYFIEGNNNAEIFYKFREKFNNCNDLVERALLFVYLNRHCFNGLCRYNKAGGFNVPFGKYKSIYFPEKEIKFFKEKLNTYELYCRSFEETIELAEPDDVLYCDPPYVPLSKTASFTDYSVGGFTMDQQRQLVKCIEKAPCKVLVSNHDTDITRDLYKNANKIISKKVSRFISARASGRKPVYELLAIYNKRD